MTKKNETLSKSVTLFSTFFKIGLLTFGGGYAMLPLIEKTVVEDNGWISHSDTLDMIAISQSTPGVIAVNMATYVGHRIAGVLGATAATIGVILPSLVIITMISFFLEPFKQIEYVDYAFRGIRAGVAVLIINAAIKLGGANKKTIFNISALLISFALSAFLNADTVLLIISAALVGMFISVRNAGKNMIPEDNGDK